MDASSKTSVSLLTTILLVTPACSADLPGFEDEISDPDGLVDSGTFSTTAQEGSSEGDDENHSTDTDTGSVSDDGTQDLLCDLACGQGTCIHIDDVEYCECPEGTVWTASSCEPCPVVDSPEFDLTLPMVSFDGRFSLNGVAPPKSEYDDANLWIENQLTHDRVLLGNTHDELFFVRVTPGIYDIIYELETPGAQVPRNRRARLAQVALFSAETTKNIDISVVSLAGPITLDGVTPPMTEYDDANILFRDTVLGEETLAGNTRAGSYSINLVSGEYEVVYRVETPGPITPRNDGAVLMNLTVPVEPAPSIEITSVPLSGEFLLAGAPAPASEYDDANIELASEFGGVVQLGNTHASNYALRVIPGIYDVVYRHETGSNVPQNHRARFDSLDANGNAVDIDIPMVQLSGALTINGAAPPVSEFDDGLLHLRGTENNTDDVVQLGNTHVGSYQVRLIPDRYDVYYSQETSGGTVPDNKHARVLADLDAMASGTVDIDIAAVAITGAFTLDNVAPPTSEYDNGRIYLRNSMTDDAVLLGSTHEGGYSAIVVPGDYEIFYEQETGGALLPSNLNAALGGLTIVEPMNFDLDLPVVALAGHVLFAGGPAPTTASDGGQLYLRNPKGDSVLLGNSFAPAYAVKLVAGTYGVYYRSEASVTTPQNENGRFACVDVQ